MKGYVELSQENGTVLCIKCLKAMSDYKYEYEEVNKSSWFGLKTQKYRNCTNTPHWYSYQSALASKLHSLMNMLKRGDPVHLSLTCYSELIKLSEGDRRSNAVFILNY